MDRLEKQFSGGALAQQTYEGMGFVSAWKKGPILLRTYHMSTALLQTLDTSYNIILMVTLSRCYSRFKENEADLKRLTILLKNQSVTHSRVWFQIFNLHQHLGANLKTRNFHKGSKKIPSLIVYKRIKKKKTGTCSWDWEEANSKCLQCLTAVNTWSRA